MTEVRGLAATGARGGAMTERDSITGAPSPPRRDLGPDLVEDFRGFAALDAGDVVLVFQEDAERVVDGLRVEDERVELHQRLGPIDRLGDAGQLEQVHAAQLLHEAHDLARQRLGRTGRLSSAEHTSELQSLMRTSYAVLCLQNKTN